jgi:peptidoglycan/xylan/chitin deacetylase (PgdA/CDA1 family)
MKKKLSINPSIFSAKHIPFSQILSMKKRIMLLYANPLRTIQLFRNKKRLINEQKQTFCLKENFLVFTCDLELTPLLLRGLKHKEAVIEINAGTNLLLKILDENKITATFFVEGYLCEKLPTLVSKIKDNGHEIGSHGYDHSSFAGSWFPVDFGFPKSLSLTNRKNNIRKSCNIIESITGAKPLAFRAPFLSIDEKTLRILKKEGFVVDCSLYNLVYGNFSIPYHPYKYDISKEGNMTLYELPITVFPLPQRKKFPSLGYDALLSKDIKEIHYSIQLIQKSLFESGYKIALFVPIVHLWEYLIYENHCLKIFEENLTKVKLFFKYMTYLGAKSVTVTQAIKKWDSMDFTF